MDGALVAAVVPSAIAVAGSIGLAFYAQRSAREAAQRESTAATQAAFRVDQINAVEKAMAACVAVHQQAWAIHNHWTRSGRETTQHRFRLEDDAGPGAADPGKLGVDLHEYFGTRMDTFHATCRTIEVFAHRLGEGSLRDALLHFQRTVEEYRKTATRARLDSVNDIQKQLNAILASGGQYIVGLFPSS